MPLSITATPTPVPSKRILRGRDIGLNRGGKLFGRRVRRHRYRTVWRDVGDVRIRSASSASMLAGTRIVTARIAEVWTG